jgi:hypothetical protein
MSKCGVFIISTYLTVFMILGGLTQWPRSAPATRRGTRSLSAD